MDRYFYSVQMFCGHKIVHMFGNIYFNGDDETDFCFRIAEWVGLELTISQLKEMLDKAVFYDELCEKVEYLGDLTEEQAIEACETYFNGKPGTRLHIRSVNEETPCGYYWFE